MDKKDNLTKSELLKFNSLGQWSLAKSEDETIKECEGPECKKKGVKIKASGFIGNQKMLDNKPAFGLYNCPNCKTTVSGPIREEGKKDG